MQQPPEPTSSGDLAAEFCATLVAQWCDEGVTDAVVCPGSRNTPITLALAANDAIRVHVVVDERSAGFVALGLAMGSGRPAVLTCTSGSAPAHFHPAVLEADLSAVPMLVVTADRPPELHGVLAPQTTDQRDLYGKAVRWYCEPGPPAAGSQRWWPDLAHDAMVRACGVRPGPVHLNLAFREPLLPSQVTDAAGGTDRATTVPDQPRVHAGNSHDSVDPPDAVMWNLTDEDLARLVGSLTTRRGVIVAGARAALTDRECDEVVAFATAVGWPIFADAPSGVRVPEGPVVAAFDSILRSGTFDEAPPEVVLRLGGLPASKVLARWLTRSGALQFGIDRYGMSPDPDHVLARSFPLVPAEVLSTLGRSGLGAAPTEWTQAWLDAAALADHALTVALEPRGTEAMTEPAVAVGVLDAMEAGSQLLVASSMPVRDLEWFARPRRGVQVYANRGTNGIDGMLSTACGLALGSAKPTALLCGDLAFLHDVGMLATLGRREIDLTVVVVDNDGGGIFHFLDQGRRLDEATFETYFGTPHGLDLVSLAEGFGIRVERVSSRAGLAAAFAGAATRGGVQMLVVPSDRAWNEIVHNELNAAVEAGLDELDAPRVST